MVNRCVCDENEVFAILQVDCRKTLKPPLAEDKHFDNLVATHAYTYK
jgi:hypothetical protein